MTTQQFTAIWDAPLWTEVVPQVAQNEPSIRHAVFALSAFHELYADADGTARDDSLADQRFGFALAQYNLSIQKLLKPDNGSTQASLYIQLLSCLIFIAIEQLQRRFTAAITVMKHGLKIIRQLQKGAMQFDVQTIQHTRSGEQDLVSFFEILFMRHECQLLELLGSNDPDYAVHLPNQTVGPALPVPIMPAFHSLEEARTAFERLAYVYMLTPIGPGRGHRIFKDSLESWEENYERYLSENREELATPANQRRIALLEVRRRHLKFSILMSTHDPFDHMNIDKYEDIHVEIIDIAENVYSNLGPAGSEPGEQTPSFQPDSGIIMALTAVANSSRNPKLRRRALEVLKRSPRQEGVWSTSIMSQLTEKVIEFEESSVEGVDEIKESADVPRYARVHGMYAALDSVEKCAVVRFSNEKGSASQILGWT